MNEDNYVEWLVKQKAPAYGILLKVVMAVLSVGSIVFAMGSIIGMILMFALWAATYFVFIRLNVEYEYLFAEGGLSVDAIYGKARRKKVFDCEKDEIQIVAPADSHSLKDYESQGMVVKDFSSRQKSAAVYALISQKGGVNTKILIEPNERMLNAMRRSFPRKIQL
jgi:hypothetical protein